MAVTVDFTAEIERIRFYVYGREAGRGTLDIPADSSDARLPVKIGYCNDNFPKPPGFTGEICDVRWYGYVLGASLIEDLTAR